jgi:hypothetical protein
MSYQPPQEWQPTALRGWEPRGGVDGLRVARPRSLAAAAWLVGVAGRATPLRGRPAGAPSAANAFPWCGQLLGERDVGAGAGRSSRGPGGCAQLRRSSTRLA